MGKIFIRALLRRLGLKVIRVKDEAAKNTETGVGELKLPAHYDVSTIIDIGVAGGTPWLYRQFATQSLILVEPLNVVDGLQESLEGRDFELYECAAGASDGTIEINHDTTRPSLSSILERTDLTRRADHRVCKKNVPVRTLDSIIQHSAFRTDSVGLKIDTEGFELEVLKGAQETLRRCKFVVCEASIERRFNDSYDFSQLVVFMHDNGFKLKKVLAFSQDENQVIRMADVLFEPNCASASRTD